MHRELFVPPKFGIPPTPDSLPRERLAAKLSQGLSHPLMVVLAPAGYGKTTAAALWLKSQQRVSSAWLSLEEADNDSIRFWQGLLAALDYCHPGLGGQAAETLLLPGSSLSKTITILCHQLSQISERLLLVLDDYHLVQAQPIHESLQFLLEQMPENISLCLLTRELPPLPLDLLRAGGQLFELTRLDLAFTDQEAEEYFLQRLKLRATRDNLRRLNRLLEGWIAGLKLLAHSSPDLPLSPANSKFQALTELLIQEALAKQPEDILHFLLVTSIPDQFTPALAELLLESSQSTPLLSRVLRANLFLLPLDQEGTWYRYHHLFRDALHLELQRRWPHIVPQLQLKTCRWLEAKGLIVQAITMALEVPDFQAAARLLEIHTTQLIRSGQLHTLVNWLNRIPEEIILGRPVLLLYCTWLNILTGRIGPATDLLQSLDNFLAAKSLPPEEWAMLREDYVITRNFLAFVQGKPEAAQVFLESLHELKGKGRIATELIPVNISPSPLQGDTGMRGNIPLVAPFYTHIGLELQRIRLEYPTFATGHTILAEVLYEQGDTERANTFVNLARRLAVNTQEPGLYIPAVMVYARIKAGSGEGLAGLEALHQALEHPCLRYSPRWTVILQAHRVRIALQIEHPEALLWAEEWQDEWGFHPRRPLSPLQSYKNLTLLTILQGRREHEAALSLAERLLPLLELDGSIGYLIELRLHQAFALSCLNSRDAAHDPLERAVSLAQKFGYQRTITDFPGLTDLLQGLLANPRNPQLKPFLNQLLGGKPHETQVLTPREREILRLLDQGCSTQDLADKLFLSPTTVKTHLKNIYRKLQVTSRIQALNKLRAGL